MKRENLIDGIVTLVREYCMARSDRETAVGPTTRLFGREGVLDSLGLVSILVDIEQWLRDEHQIAVSLMSEKAMSQSRSPFQTPETVADYVLQQLSERTG